MSILGINFPHEYLSDELLQVVASFLPFQQILCLFKRRKAFPDSVNFEQNLDVFPLLI